MRGPEPSNEKRLLPTALKHIKYCSRSHCTLYKDKLSTESISPSPLRQHEVLPCQSDYLVVVIYKDSPQAQHNAM